MMTNHRTKECLNSHWISWMDLKDKLTVAYIEKDPAVVNLMEEAIELYCTMMKTSHQVGKQDNISVEINITPLNETERLEFIREKIAGRFAFIQLDALFSEARKKAVSQLAMKSK